MSFQKQTVWLFPQPRAQYLQEPSLALSTCLLVNLPLQSWHPATTVAASCDLSPSILRLKWQIGEKPFYYCCSPVLTARTHRPGSTKQPLSKILRHDFADNQILTPNSGGFFFVFHFLICFQETPNTVLFSCYFYLVVPP